VYHSRRVPVRIPGRSDLFLLHGLPSLRFGYVQLPCGMKPGTPVFTT
jgi:hypothetical protein